MLFTAFEKQCALRSRRCACRGKNDIQCEGATIAGAGMVERYLKLPAFQSRAQRFDVLMIDDAIAGSPCDGGGM
ncbi:hypothetical protein GCM10009552_09090 [Rothia nasimurium]